MRKEYTDLLIAKQFFFSMTKSTEHQLKDTDEAPVFNSGRWLQEEHRKFIEAIFLFGNEWRKVERYIKTRSAAQARSHAQKFFINIQKKYLEEHGHGGVVSNQDDLDSVSQCLIKFVISNLNCENISSIFRDQKEKGEGSELYKDDSKYKFMLNLQKLKNSMMNSTAKKDFLNQLKETFIKLVLNLLHNTRAHNRKLATLGSCFENNKHLITLICCEPEIEIEAQTNPFYLSEFEVENKNETEMYSCNNNYANDLGISNNNDSVTSIFDSGSIYNYSLIL